MFGNVFFMNKVKVDKNRENQCTKGIEKGQNGHQVLKD